MDWGLAKVLRPDRGAGAEANQSENGLDPSAVQTVRSADEAAWTGTGRAMGTLLYMPPEQARGQTSAVDKRCDVFALGAILCEILTGRPPYQGDSRRLLERVREGNLDEAMARLDGCGADVQLIELAQHGLAPAHESRPRDAGQVAAALKAYQDGLRERLRQTELDRAAASAREAEAVRTIQAERRARRRMAALAIAVAILLAGGAGAGWHLQKQRTDEAAAAAAQRSALERDVAAEVREVRTFLGQGWQLRDVPERWAASLRSARVAYERTERLLDQGEATDAARQSVAEIKTSLEAAERSQRLVRSFERIRNRLADSTGGQWNVAELDVGYADAFKEFGLDFLQDEKDSLVERLQGHPLRERLLDALEEWHALTLDQKTKDRLSAFILAADPTPDSFRRRVREAVLSNDQTALLKLARSEEAKKLSPTATYNLARHVHYSGIRAALPAAILSRPAILDLRTSTTRDLPAHYPGRAEALELLREGTLRFPDDFWLHTMLVGLMDDQNEAERSERLLHALAAVAVRPSSGAAHFSLGVALDGMGDSDRAIASYRKAVELDPDEARAFAGLGFALQRKNQLDEAVAQFRHAIKLVPRYAKAHGNLGFALMTQGKVQEAIAAYREAIACDPNDFLTHVLLGLALQRQHDLPGARDELRTAIRLNPDDGVPHLQLAHVLRESGELDDAIASYRRALKLSAKMERALLADAHHGLGLVFARKGNLQDAATAFQIAVQTEPANPTYQASLTGLRAQTAGDRKKSVALLQEAVNKDPKDERLHLELADALAETGADEAALAAYRKCIELNPKNAVAQTRLGSALLRKKDLDNAIRALTTALEVDANLSAAHVALGAAHLQKGNVPAAAASVRKGLALNERDDKGWALLATVLEQFGDTAGTIDAYRKALALDENNVPWRCGLGKALGRKGDFPAALAEFQKAVKADPRSLEAHVGVGGVRAAMKDVDGAIEAFRTANGIKKEARTLGALVGLLLGKGDWKNAEATLRELADVDPVTAPTAHAQRVDCLIMLGDYETAQKAARESIKLAPTSPFGHYTMGLVLLQTRKEEEAIDAFRQAVKLAPGQPEFRFALGVALFARQSLQEATDEIRRAVTVCPPGHPRLGAMLQQQRLCEMILKLQPTLPDLVGGKDLPTDAEELLALAYLCRTEKNRYFATAVRAYAAAIASKPDSANDVTTDHRHQSAAAAVLVADGQGEDVAQLDEQERLRLRQQGLDWLKADLSLLTRVYDKGPSPERSLIRLWVQRVRSNPDLACVRDAGKLEKLSEAERMAWKQFWAEVDGLHKKIGESPK
jgi:eukaryotic-like serine/threonine-protein kinase